ncbi:hypothetical protein ABH908_004066 [Pseudomonas frederiksbergensis]|uniref:hypothetical protein n=1 Tax=Pseudomonas TaxID=286 RepID=UPI000DABCB8E|nr:MULTISPECIES: hypothetical protein [unclassified Pseudomonas]MBD9616361.1 hypothetical protein [Pseudomonas sp. PDM07]PZW61602.1 hypothetical protein F475_02435 [Pseudomonas sp. URMO17WK12:I6]QDV96305.1 hypothetical protein FFH90_019220 [Pseudomonas sp. ATCC 43928]CAH0308786.1 hypothetical protein SRABI130_04987 [Pseudomonas sp. Bi130]
MTQQIQPLLKEIEAKLPSLMLQLQNFSRMWMVVLTALPGLIGVVMGSIAILTDRSATHRTPAFSMQN